MGAQGAMKKRLVRLLTSRFRFQAACTRTTCGQGEPTRSGDYAPTSVPFSIRTRWPWPNGGGLWYVNVRVAPFSICTCT